LKGKATECHKLRRKPLSHSWQQAGIATKGNPIKGPLCPYASLHRHQLLATVTGNTLGKPEPFLCLESIK